MRATVSTVTDAKDKARQLCWSHQRLAAASILRFLTTQAHPRTRVSIQVWSSSSCFAFGLLKSSLLTTHAHHPNITPILWMKHDFTRKSSPENCHYLLTLMLFRPHMTFFLPLKPKGNLQKNIQCHFPYDKIIQSYSCQMTKTSENNHTSRLHDYKSFEVTNQ